MIHGYSSGVFFLLPTLSLSISLSRRCVSLGTPKYSLQSFWNLEYSRSKIQCIDVFNLMHPLKKLHNVVQHYKALSYIVTSYITKVTRGVEIQRVRIPFYSSEISSTAALLRTALLLCSGGARRFVLFHRLCTAILGAGSKCNGLE
uniref:Secreted protein n=1 Tax=Trichogramma kaykai TaxID=54128 RepID=A0ABD2WFC9_9HYME